MRSSPHSKGRTPISRRMNGGEDDRATAHYASEELDRGPIIEQDVVRVSHELDLFRLEEPRQGCGTARAHQGGERDLESRVIIYKNRTIVFGPIV